MLDERFREETTHPETRGVWGEVAQIQRERAFVYVFHIFRYLLFN